MLINTAVSRCGRPYVIPVIAQTVYHSTRPGLRRDPSSLTHRVSLQRYSTSPCKTSWRLSAIHSYGNVSIVQISFLWSESVPDRPDYWCRYYVHLDAQGCAKWKTNKQLESSAHCSLCGRPNKKSSSCSSSSRIRRRPNRRKDGSLSFSTQSLLPGFRISVTSCSNVPTLTSSIVVARSIVFKKRCMFK